MPLSEYGVVVGDVVSFTRDQPDNYGRWYHGHLNISTPFGQWTSALDVDTPNGLGVRYRTSTGLNTGVLGPVANLVPGFHLLAHDTTSGAIDYLRSPFLLDLFLIWARAATLGMPRVPVPIPPLPGPDELPIARAQLPVVDSLKERLLRFVGLTSRVLPPFVRFRVRPWILSNGDNALAVLEQHLAVGRRAYLWGQRYTVGNGVHDVHQNQGDPAGSPWWATNGIWQDGAVAIVQPDGSLFFWQVRFESQATSTDANGHPA